MPALLLAIAALALASCKSNGAAAPDAPAKPADPSAARGAEPRPRRKPRLERARCPADLSNCSATSGRVLYVEAVDPDGDGDAHYVLAGGDITAPGLSVIDVPVGLRPKRLPRAGDRVSAAGPVYRGSYGQRQIEAIEVHHSPRR